LSNGSDDFDQPQNANFLRRQLERSRFERALEVVDSLVDRRAFLNSAELARLNNILRGERGEPWREQATVCQLPSGRNERFQILSDPIKKAREILHHASEQAASGQVVEAAAELYAQLVLNHVFKDANRRSAVLAAAYLLKFSGVHVSAMGLHELGLGDLRVPGQLDALRETIRNVVKMSGPVKIGSRKPTDP
jgi:hypothetical protein